MLDAIYHAGRYGDGPRIQYDPEGSTQERRAAIDLYILNPELVAEIDNGEIMRRISFIFMGSLNIIPVIGDKTTIGMLWPKLGILHMMTCSFTVKY